MTLELTTAPASEPLTLAEAKAHLRVDHSAEDAQITEAITSVREDFEHFTGRRLVEQTWDLHLPCFARTLEIPTPPLRSVEHIKYLDPDGVEQTMDAADYIVNAKRTPGVVVPAVGKNWPSVQLHDGQDSVTVRFVCGYGPLTADVPRRVRSALKLMLAAEHQHRGADLCSKFEANPALQRLLWQFRIEF